MAKRITVDYLSEKLNLSKTTISKAINNCPGIKPDTKTKIINAANEYGYLPERPSQKVAVVLPSVPDYFWGQMRKNIYTQAKKLSIDCKFYVYTHLLDQEDALNCINLGIESKASVLIVAAPDTPEIIKRLEAVSNRLLIILIEELIGVKNAFFIGGDFENEGFNLCEKYFEINPNAKQFAIVKASSFYNEKLRIKGFLEALEKRGITKIAEIETPAYSRTSSAFVARELDKLKSPPECVFCPSGNIESCCLAVKKLKSEREIHCIGFDLNPKSRMTESRELKLYSNQDVEGQAKKAVECTNRFLQRSLFPSTKNIFLENIYFKT